MKRILRFEIETTESFTARIDVTPHNLNKRHSYRSAWGLIAPLRVK